MNKADYKELKKEGMMRQAEDGIFLRVVTV